MTPPETPSVQAYRARRAVLAAARDKLQRQVAAQRAAAAVICEAAAATREAAAAVRAEAHVHLDHLRALRGDVATGNAAGAAARVGPGGG